MENQRTFLDQLVSAKQQLSKNVQHALSLIQRDMNNIHNKIDQKEGSLIEEIQAIKTRQLDKLKSKVDSLHRDLEEIVRLHKSVQYICDDGTPIQFLQSHAAMAKDLDAAIEADKKRDREIGIQPTLHLQVFVDDVLEGINRLRVDSSLYGECAIWYPSPPIPNCK
jgi:hypothetical protein